MQMAAFLFIFEVNDMKKSILYIVLGILILLIGILTICLNPKDYDKEITSEVQEEPNEEKIPEDITKAEASANFPIVLEQGLQIQKSDSYTGPYWEDGSDEEVADLLMIELKNISGKDIQIAVVQLMFGEKEAVFQITNLPNGESVLALEQNREKYTEEIPSSVTVENIAYMDEFSMQEETVKITAFDGIINVENISEKDIEQTIFIYYKNYEDGQYHGGITYRVRIEGGLKSGEIRQLKASHFHEGKSRLLMVSFGG